MTTYSVRLSVAAQEDVSEIEAWIAGQTDEIVAARYVDRIENCLSRLSLFPNRGSLRPEIGPDIQSIVFERRYLVLYAVGDAEVAILRVISGLRDLTNLLGN